MTGTALSPSVCFGEALLVLLLLEQSKDRSGKAVSQAHRPCLYCHMHQPRNPVIQECCFKATIEIWPLHSSINIPEWACCALCNVSNIFSSFHSSEVPWSARSSSTLHSVPSAASPAQWWAQWPGHRSHGGPFQRLAILDCRRCAGLHRTPHCGLHPLLPLESLVQTE